MKGWTWRCLHCSGPLTCDAHNLQCAACGARYPRITGIPILVREPAAYLRSELALLTRAGQDARQRIDSLDRAGADAGLPAVSIARHRDRLRAEIAQAEAFLALLEPAAQALREDSSEALGARPSGWTTDSLIPYLLRDWTGTAELEAVSTRIGAALRRTLGAASGKSVVFAACGAAGLLAKLAPDFERILGFDLTLPVLRAARHLLDGNSLDIPLPRAINESGHITLRGLQARSPGARAELVAMDAFETAFPDASVDCVITSFMIDLIPAPRRLADEIHRILGRDGVWINYGPSGALNGFWRFDQAETAAFFQAAGFTVEGGEAYRATYLDLSRDCPSWSFQSHVCYLTWGRKTARGDAGSAQVAPAATELGEIVPTHFPGATLIERRSLGPQARLTRIFRHEGTPGRANSVQIGGDAARILALVDGQRTVNEIAGLLDRETPPLAQESVRRAFERYFQQGLLRSRGR